MQAITGHDDEALQRLIEQLTSSDADADRVLNGLASHPLSDVRGWAVWFATHHRNPASDNVLSRLAADADPDVRMDARRGLVDNDARAIRRLTPDYLAAVQSPEPVEAVDAIWQLVRYRGPHALEPLRDLADDPTAHRAVRSTARVGMLVITGGEEQLLWGLRQHDHASMDLWMKGLLYLGTEASISALEEVAERGQGETCRERARDALTKRHAVRPLLQQ